MYDGLNAKYPLFWSDFSETLIVWTVFRKKKKLEYQNLLKIRPEERICSMRTDRHEEANKRFSNFALFYHQD